MANYLFLFALIITLTSAKARGGGNGAAPGANPLEVEDDANSLPAQYGFSEETHYIRDQTFVVVNETLSPYEPKTLPEYDELEAKIKNKREDKLKEKAANDEILLKQE